MSDRILQTERLTMTNHNDLGIVLGSTNWRGECTTLARQILPAAASEKALRILRSRAARLVARNRVVSLGASWHMHHGAQTTVFIYAPSGGLAPQETAHMMATDCTVAYVLPRQGSPALVQDPDKLKYLPPAVKRRWYP